MKKRFKMSPKSSKRLFTKKAVSVHPRNNLRPMRGGIRA